MVNTMTVFSHRTLWLSDIHLGNRDCKAEFLVHFLTHNKADTLILVGDIVDLWSLKNKHFWPESHNQIIRLILKRAEQGCRVIYIPGNHDGAIRKFLAYNLGAVELYDQYTHTTASGRRILALHGDQFDSLVCHSRFYAMIGDLGYDALLFINRWWHLYRKLRNKPYWSLAGYLKARVEQANQAIERFSRAAVNYARQQEVDGIICGHIHHPDIADIDGILYLNDGDWIESCTYMAESHQGEISLSRWTDKPHRLASHNGFRVDKPAPHHRPVRQPVPAGEPILTTRRKADKVA